MKTWMPLLVICAACQTGPRSVTAPTNASTTTVAELAARRAQMIEYLREYYEAGRYPTDDSGRVISVFRDTKGVRCPMAELIYRSGHPDLVDAVVAENNEVTLADVKSGPLHDWMLASGLTGEEIAMVQGIPRDLDYTFDIQIQEIEPTQTILAKARVRGRLETAVTALRNGTAPALQNAIAHLPDQKVPAVAAVAGKKILPNAALTSRARAVATMPAPQPQQIRVVRRGRVDWPNVIRN